jgi:transporter family-2 protein
MSVVAGLAGAAQVAVMSQFGDRVGIFAALAFSTLVTAAIALALLLVARHSLAGYAGAAHQPVWLWSGAVMSLFIVLTITYAGSRIGTTAAIGILIGGQLTMGAVIDRFGLFGVDKIPLHWPRVAGILLLCVGAALSLRR